MATGQGGCQHTPIVCDDAQPCTSNECDPVTGCFFDPLVVPGEVTLQHAADKQTINWSPEAVSTSYDVVRGAELALPVGPGGGDESCTSTLVASVNDATVPGVGTAAFYVVRGKNQTCPGPYGNEHQHPQPPLNGPPRVTTTCP
jgi:hypothetical protein